MVNHINNHLEIMIIIHQKITIVYIQKIIYHNNNNNNNIKNIQEKHHNNSNNNNFIINPNIFNQMIKYFHNHLKN